jgi:hypothetical protein
MGPAAHSPALNVHSRLARWREDILGDRLTPYEPRVRQRQRLLRKQGNFKAAPRSGQVGMASCRVHPAVAAAETVIDAVGQPGMHIRRNRSVEEISPITGV